MYHSQFPYRYYTWVTIQFHKSHFDMGALVCFNRIDGVEFPSPV
jgi:hypothetical protein